MILEVKANQLHIYAEKKSRIKWGWANPPRGTAQILYERIMQ
jgi:hypothetical protein